MLRFEKKKITVIMMVALVFILFLSIIQVCETTAETPKDYYLNEIESTVQKVKRLTTEPSLVFFVCTDLHYNSLKKNTLKMDTVTDMSINMKVLKDRIKVDGLICLGDIVDAQLPAKTEEVEKQIQYVMRRFKSTELPLIYCIGNHDDFRYISSKVGNVFTPKQLYSMYMSSVLPQRVSDESMQGLNYYVNYDKYKIRVFVLDSNYQDINKNNKWRYGFSDNTLSWFCKQLQNIPSGWSILVLTHRRLIQSNNTEVKWLYNQRQMMEAVEKYIANGGSYIATIYGHIHRDYDNRYPFLEFSVGAQRFGNLKPNAGAVAPLRKKNTATEDLWDVLIIKPNSRKIHTVRFGAGFDREWSY